eukprot:GHVN01078795.1.p1 GENE.GHVN01078795.1~~GHVN01078795.1.p1  ORF type:complete len:331 (+),score=76.38 GHVN01078795.1:214-1206(+)
MGSRMKEAIVIVLDCGATMKEIFVDDEKEDDKDGKPRSRFEMAKEALILLLQQKMMFAPKDEIGLVCFGAEVTDNSLNEQYSGQYLNVVSARPIAIPDIDLLSYIDEEAQPCEEKADVIDGLVVAIDALAVHCGDKKYNKKIYLFTDGATAISNPDDLEPIANQIKGPDWSFLAVGIGMSSAQSTPIQMQSNELLDGFAASCDGLVLPMSNIFDSLKGFKTRKVNQISKCRLVLEVTPFMKIPVWCFLKTKVEALPSLKKFSTRAQPAAQPDISDDEEEGGGPDVDFGKVRMDRSYRLLNDPDGEEVPPEERKKAFTYGKQLTLFTHSVE